MKSQESTSKAALTEENGVSQEVNVLAGNLLRMDNRNHFPALEDNRPLPKALILLCNCDRGRKPSNPLQKENQSSNPWEFRLNDV